MPLPAENPAFLTQQLITYIGSKRALLGFIGQGISIVQKRMNKKKLDIFDVFSGSGIAARYFKQYANSLIVNDLEKYSAVCNQCYLSNKSELDMPFLHEIHRTLTDELANAERDGKLMRGIIAESYAPKNDGDIQMGERAFYTTRNARYIDTARLLIDGAPQPTQHYFLAPLLSEASIHANTAGVFKGFYKNRDTKIGQFGGRRQDALQRITGFICLPFPVFSEFDVPVTVHCEDANSLVSKASEVDVAYIDPPYNQHPYGSNYFMLNLILEYTQAAKVSKVSGIPKDWNRSDYNKAQYARAALQTLIENLKAKFVLVSFNSDGFIPEPDMTALLGKYGKVDVLEIPYNTFRGSRNLRNRHIHIKEYLYVLEK